MTEPTRIDLWPTHAEAVPLMLAILRDGRESEWPNIENQIHRTAATLDRVTLALRVIAEQVQNVQRFIDDDEPVMADHALHAIREQLRQFNF